MADTTQLKRTVENNDDVLVRYRAREMLELFDSVGRLKTFDFPLMLRTIDRVETTEDEKLTFMANGKGKLYNLSVRHHAMLLHKALQTACQLGLLQRNPADNVTLPKAKQQKIEWKKDRF